MAGVISLGIHEPSALPYLVSEGILPQDPPNSLYDWTLYEDYRGVGEEEILRTENCVIWSQNGFIRKVYKFQKEDQKVQAAILARYTGLETSEERHVDTSLQATGKSQARSSAWGGRPIEEPPSKRRRKDTGVSSSTGRPRALTIFLCKEVHIHFLAGPSHVISLPFDIENVYAAEQGLLVQRRTGQTKPVLSSPSMPPVPPNSFFSLQTPGSQSKTPCKGRRSSQFPGSSLPQELMNPSAATDDEDTPRLYTLKNPLSGFCPLSHATLSYQPRQSRSAQNDLVVEYDDLENSEDIIYVSQSDEQGQAYANVEGETAPLLLLVTANHELGQITIWQGWYLRPPSLASFMSKRALVKASRARRRSSFVEASTGMATPLIRHRDKARESYAAGAHLPMDAVISQKGHVKVTKKQSPDDEEVMASQMDPEFRIGQNPSKDSRRLSSLLSRGDLSTAEQGRAHAGSNASLAGTGRRGPSLGASQDRRSLGNSTYRRSRGSTPGSVFSRSIGVDDDLMDLETNGDSEERDVEQVVKLYQATQMSVSLEAVLGDANEGSRQDFVVRKLHTIPLQTHHSSSTKSRLFKVITLRAENDLGLADQSMSVFILDAALNQTEIVDIHISNSSGPIPTPAVRQVTSINDTLDIVKIRQKDIHGVICSTSTAKLRVFTNSGSSWVASHPDRLRVHDPSDVRRALSQSKREVGKTRTIKVPLNSYLLQAGRSGQVDLSAKDGTRHRVQLRMRPHSDEVFRILEMCRFVIGGDAGAALLRTWMSVHTLMQAERQQSSDAVEAEWETLVVTLFAFSVGSITRTSTGLQRDNRAHPRRSLSRAPAALGPTAEDQASESKSGKLVSSAWDWMSSADIRRSSQRSSREHKGADPSTSRLRSASMIEFEARARHCLHSMAQDGLEWLVNAHAARERYTYAIKVLFAVHLYREEQKLKTLIDKSAERFDGLMVAALAQMGHWLKMEAWTWAPGTYYEMEGATDQWDFSRSVTSFEADVFVDKMLEPPSIFEWLERSTTDHSPGAFLCLDQVSQIGQTTTQQCKASTADARFLPRSTSIRCFIAKLSQIGPHPEKIVEASLQFSMGSAMIETLPEAVLAPLQEAIAQCQRSPPPAWSPVLKCKVGREDLTASRASQTAVRPTMQASPSGHSHDVVTIFALAERLPHVIKTHEADRHAITSLVFAEDRRMVDAVRMTTPTAVQLAECPVQPEWSEAEHLDQQKRLMQWVMVRTMALPPGNAMVHFESQRPLLSEKFHIGGFNTMCQMKPTDNTVSADRSTFTEEKVGWAFFHAGVSAGLHISHKATGIDTSWIVFNKPIDLNNRHAGFLLALGLNGHLRSLAKWLAFKYLTPKHTMTSVGLLLGLSASHLGTMDSLITRMLSVHITRMLPQGAAELNVSSATQTAGLMGIGLLYYNTQHRRMSEIMLSELEHREVEDSGSTTDLLRDESYRLAAGFALGFINLGRGLDLQGLHGMGLLERLLSVAVGPRPVELVHVVDKAVAGAVMAIAFIYMKSGDKTVARKIDVPDTLAQLDHVRPDILMLRTMAKNLIMWDEVKDDRGWILKNLPRECASRYANLKQGTVHLPKLKSDDVPFFNVLTGLAWSLSLKYAGSANRRARDEVLEYIKFFTALSKHEAYYYDAMLARNTVRRCIDMLALAAATIMAGTGDLETFRYLRRLHGRTDPSTTYGSHLASHLAIGTLFLGGGTYTFGTSNLAIASLVCAFYPLFPSDVLDNNVHLQALRHLWVFAAEARCIVVEDIDTQRPVSLDLQLVLRNGAERLVTAPCLLPELDTIATIKTNDPAYWQVTLDFAGNPEHLASFKANQVLRVRRAPPQLASSLLFSTTLTALNETQNTPKWRQMWEWILQWPSFKTFDEADLGLVLPQNAQSSVQFDDVGTIVDDRLVLAKSAVSGRRNDLWHLRLLFRWAEEAQMNGDGRLRWLGKEVVDKLRGCIEDTMRDTAD